MHKAKIKVGFKHYMVYKYELVDQIRGINDFANFWSVMVTVPILQESPNSQFPTFLIVVKNN